MAGEGVTLLLGGHEVVPGAVEGLLGVSGTVELELLEEHYSLAAPGDGPELVDAVGEVKQIVGLGVQLVNLKLRDVAIDTLGLRGGGSGSVS